MAFRGPSILARYPEVYFVILAWIPAFVLSWLRTGIHGQPYTFATAVFVSGALVLALVPAAWIGGPLGRGTVVPDNLTRLGTVQRLGLLIGCNACALVSMVIGWHLRGDLSSLGLDGMRDARQLAIGGDHGRLGQLNYIPSALGLLGPLLAGRMITTLRWAVVYGAGLVAATIVFYMKTGLRTETLPLLGVYAAAMLSSPILHAPRAMRRVMTVMAVGAAGLLGINATLTTMGMTGGLMGYGMSLVCNRGAVILQPIGLDRAPDTVLMVAGQADEYMFAPIFYLDFYLAAAEMETADGGHQFDVASRRFGIPEAPELKLQVDELYEEIGITHNVWATALREMCIDFGKRGTLVAWFIAGAILGISKRLRTKYICADWLYCIGFAYLLISPFMSLFKSQFMELAFYTSILGLIAEITLGLMGSRATSTAGVPPRARYGLAPGNA